MKNIKKPIKPKGFMMLLLMVFFSWEVFAAQKLPVIKAGSREVKIRVDDEKIYDWYLMPEVKPDVFTLPRFFGTKQLNFVTDTDSLILQIKPDSAYHFTVLLHGKEPCYTRIETLKAPLLLHLNVGLTTFLGLILVGFTGYVRRDIMKTRHLLTLGIITPLFFWVMTLCGGLIHGNYHHFKNVVSELGGIGRSSEVFMTGAEVVLAVMCAFFSLGLYKAAKTMGLSTVPVWLSLGMPVSMLWAAVFPMGHEWHGVLGALPLLINFGALLAFVLWRRDRRVSGIRALSLLSFVLMMLILTKWVPSIEQPFPGLVQRFFYLGWSVWYVSLALGFISILDKKERYYR